MKAAIFIAFVIVGALALGFAMFGPQTLRWWRERPEKGTKMSTGGGISLGLVGAFLLIGLIGLGMWGCPTYNVWEQGLAGKAALKRAEQDRQIRVQEAQAELDASELLNQAEVARAKGLAAATEIAADKFGGPEAYLRYLWIQNVAGNNNDLIYVPTEANMPILEAARFSNPRTDSGLEKAK